MSGRCKMDDPHHPRNWGGTLEMFKNDPPKVRCPRCKCWRYVNMFGENNRYKTCDKCRKRPNKGKAT